MTSDAPVLIAICTFRRAGIADTLASLARLRPCGLPVRIAIADNDATPSARLLIEALAADHPLPITYLHAPVGNISIARNALLEHGRATGARLMAWIDDDETAEPGWLAGLVSVWHEASNAAAPCVADSVRARRKPDIGPRTVPAGAGAVLGPVRAHYQPGVPAWMERARPHDTLPVTRQGLITSGYTCNMLLDLSDPAVQGLCFDPDRGRTGGEDSAFFAAYLARGGRIGFAQDALVNETVPDDRAGMGWLLKRRYRMGQTHASLAARDRGTLGRLAAGGLAGLKAAACTGLALLGAACADRRNRQILRAALHLGALAHLAGARRTEPYGIGGHASGAGPTTHPEEQ